MSSWKPKVRANEAHFENDNVKINVNCLGALRAMEAAIKLSHYRLKFDLNVSSPDPSTPDAVNNFDETNIPSEWFNLALAIGALNNNYFGCEGLAANLMENLQLLDKVASHCFVKWGFH